MPVKVLKNDGRELRLRVIGGTHTALQMFRSRLNDRDDVEYANYFQNHPDLDDPELYVRTVKGKKADKILTDICSEITKEFSSVKFLGGGLMTGPRKEGFLDYTTGP